MKRSQTQSQQHTGELSPGLSLAKRPRSIMKQDTHNFPPSFWDDLSKVWLTPRALRELDRRNNMRPSLGFVAPEACSKKRGRFARRGGPDLRYLRGYPNSDRHSASQDDQTRSRSAITAATSSSMHSANDINFQQHLTDNHMHVIFHMHGDKLAPPNNFASDLKRLKAKRASLSQSRFSPSAFKDFKHKDVKAVSEYDVINTVLPIICGSSEIPHKQNVLFTALEPIAREVVIAEPDFLDGAQLDGIEDAKHDIESTSIPTADPSIPVAQNFFLGAKAIYGPSDGQNHAAYVAAYGTRPMHALQNSVKEEVAYDGNAYTYSSTYHEGILRLYAHHVTAPTTVGGKPTYHMTRMRAFVMTTDLEGFVKGATALRNARDLAQRHRASFTQGVDASGYQADMETEAEEPAETNDFIPAARELHGNLQPSSQQPDTPGPHETSKRTTSNFKSSHSTNRRGSKRRRHPGHRNRHSSKKRKQLRP